MDRRDTLYLRLKFESRLKDLLRRWVWFELKQILYRCQSKSIWRYLREKIRWWETQDQQRLHLCQWYWTPKNWNIFLDLKAETRQFVKDSEQLHFFLLVIGFPFSHVFEIARILGFMGFDSRWTEQASSLTSSLVSLLIWQGV